MIDPAALQAYYGGLGMAEAAVGAWEPAPDNGTVPPDPTRRETVWGQEYPCLRYRASDGNRSAQCGGMVRRTSKRAYVFDHHLWHHFKCDRCGREADDRKVRDAE